MGYLHKQTAIAVPAVPGCALVRLAKRLPAPMELTNRGYFQILSGIIPNIVN